MEDVDGSGFSLTIPALLIGKKDATTLKQQFKSGDHDIKLVVDLEISHAKDAIVEVGLWYGSTLDLDPAFLQGLYDYQHVLQKNVKFTPHIITMQCPICVFEVKEKECLSDGLYCLIPPKDAIGS